MRRAPGSCRGASSVSPHDGLGSNLVVQVKNDRVMRVLPLENEAINECWLSDKDRFSYEGARTPTSACTSPMVKQGGEWKAVDWQTALEFVANGLRDIVAKHGAGAVGCARVAAFDARGDGACRATDARPRQRQRRLPAAADRFPRRRPARRRSVARHADRRCRQARSRRSSWAASCARTIRCSRTGCGRRRRRARRFRCCIPSTTTG